MDRISPVEFKHVFRFERFIKTANNSGGSAENFEFLFNARGKWVRKNERRLFDDGQDLLVTTYKVTCYWRGTLEAVINKDLRLIYENEIFKIEGIERVGERRQYYRFTVVQAN